QAEDGIRDGHVTGVQTCALPIFVGGCDYNVQLADKVRFVTALKKLNEFRSVEGLKKKYSIDHLNYEECRKLFAPVDYTEVIDPRSEERRVGKESKYRCSSYHETK